MLNVQQISNAASDISNGHISVEDFERWLRRASRNVHAWGSPKLLSAVLSVEAVLSDYRFSGLEESKVAEELANAIRPFEYASPNVVLSSEYGRKPFETATCARSGHISWGVVGEFLPMAASNSAA